MQGKHHAAPSSLRVRRWQRGHWEYIDEVASREERLVVDYPDGQCRLWACPLALEPLALGHVILDQAHDGPEDAPSPLGLRRGSAELLPAEKTEPATGQGLVHRARVSLSPRGQSATHADCGRATAAHISHCMERALAIPGMWDGTGCFHRAALVHIPTDDIRLWTEDIGRHNCLDRLAGLCSVQGFSPEEHALFISARITASLYRKARRAGFRFMVSRAAVTSESLERALAQGVTLVGYCRSQEQRLTVFADGLGRVLTE